MNSRINWIEVKFVRLENLKLDLIGITDDEKETGSDLSE